MGCASKLLMLLTSPFPFRPSALRLTRLTTAFSSSFPKRTLSSSSSTSRPLLRFPSTSKHLHTHSARVTREDFHSDPSPAFPPNNPTFSHPWPEWSKLVDCLRGSGYFDRQVLLDGEDALSVFENLPDEFLQAVGACLAFARRRNDLLGSLSRRDMENVVGNGSPFLFKSVTDSAKRMKSFLGIGPGNELEFERAHTVDLMRFLLSYAYNPSGVSDGNNLGNGQLVESSVRYLLSEIADASRVDQEFEISHSTPRQFSDGYGQTTRPPRQNIEMKRGDWICPKCSFMNFARNMKCLECSEARPKRQLTGGEWECPQCDFFNYGKNVSCLRCDCRRPGEASFGTAETRPGMGYSKESNLNKVGMANTSAAPLEQRFAGSPFQGNLQSDGTLPGNNGPSYGRSTAAPMTQNLDRILGRSSSASETNYNLTAAGENSTGNERSSFSSSTSPQFRRSEGNKSDYVPFVPLPADMFAKPHNSSEEKQITSNYPAEVKSSVFGKSGDSFSLSEKQVNQTQSEEDKEQAEKSERWFKKVSELHDVPDLTSAISDEDFPEIMPMRKGENRFVVSKKKDRSLTSPLHKRRMAMEQTNTTNFVPFVPFPPDYFAKKDKEPDTGSASTTPEMQGVPEKLEENKFGVPNTGTIRTSPQSTNSRQATDNNWNTTFSGKSVNENKIDYGYVGNSTQRPNDIRTSNGESWNSSSWKDNRSDVGNLTRSTTEQLDNNQSSRESYGGFTGKSLEGSLVKEPDPLDMSEEAKAERWFRRAAQIKDISELSQIPDEDFPSIMPMRKGVNRFVVSKRKTPMERRLTSPQYRRNLPIVSSEPIKKENNDS